MSVTPMNAIDWLTLIALGGMLGMVGQGARTVVGLKKAGDESTAQGQTLKDNFVTSQLVTSLMIGFVAGALGALGVMSGDISTKTNPGLLLNVEQVIAIIAIGYAGTDFIEGFMRSKLPQTGAAGAAAAGKAPATAEEAQLPPAMG